MAEYMIPVNLDVPTIDVTFLDDPDPFINPVGVKGVGEINIVGVAATRCGTPPASACARRRSLQKR